MSILGAGGMEYCLELLLLLFFFFINGNILQTLSLFKSYVSFHCAIIMQICFDIFPNWH